MIRIKWLNVIRIFGLALVLGYHLFYSGLPAGFFGCDIFFVLSGYLIMSQSLIEIREKRIFNPFTLYRKRLARFFVPLFLAVVLTLPLTTLASPDFLVGIGRQTAAALGFATNWYEIFTGGNYESELLPRLFTHTWFLAVEMQYYILWALFCGISSLLFLKIQDEAQRTGSFRALVLAASIVCGALSWRYMNALFEKGGNLSGVYYNTFARLFPFCIGAALASLPMATDFAPVAASEENGFSARKWSVFLLILSSAVLLGIICIFARSLSFENIFVWRYGFLLVSLLTALLILCLGALHRRTPLDRREPVILEFTANLSYAAYLVHWPFYVIFSSLLPSDNLRASLLTLIATYVASEFIFRGVGWFFRPKDQRPFRRPLTQAVTAALVLVATAASGYVLKEEPVMTGMGREFAVGNVIQGLSGIHEIKTQLSAINPIPVIDTEGILFTGKGSSRISALTETFRQEARAHATLTFPIVNYPAFTPAYERTETTSYIPLDDSFLLAMLDDPLMTELSERALRNRTETTVQEKNRETLPEKKAVGNKTGKKADKKVGKKTQEKAPPKKTAEPLPEKPAWIPDGGVTIIADSVALGAAATIKKKIYGCYLDAKVSRSMSMGYTLFKELKDKGQLKKYVVIALGTNGVANIDKIFTQIIDELPPGHRLIFVTPYDGRPQRAARIERGANWERSLPRGYPYITIADWAKLAAAHLNIMSKDRVHMGGQRSMNLFADCILDALRAASQKPEKR